MSHYKLHARNRYCMNWEAMIAIISFFPPQESWNLLRLGDSGNGPILCNVFMSANKDKKRGYKI